MPPPRRATAVLAALCSVLALAGCSVVVLGRPSPAGPSISDVPPGEVRIEGATDDPIDELARNALADLQTYWGEQFPDVFGEEFTPLQGGYFSVDPDSTDPRERVGCGELAREVENNAFYCQSPGTPNSDSITYDRAFLGELARDYGRFIPALVMAHEFGHAVQGRVGMPQASILAETQADCFAGAWTAWVAAGKADHSELQPDELDQLLRGYFLLRDPVGTSPGQQQAHGSFFDRVSAFQEGFDDGPTACRDDFGRDRVLTQGQFTTDEDLANQGNAPYDELIDIVDRSLPAVWTQAFRDVFSARFDPPKLQPFDGEAPPCAGDAADDLVYCSDGNLVGYDETDLTRKAYSDLGDFAVATAISLPYSEAVRDQLGRSTDGEAAVRSSVCLTGWYAAKVFNRQGGEQVLISPGDIDESVQFLLTYADEPTVIPDVGLSGFQLVDLFRNGFVRGLSACDVGV
jgi:predicted metalloprotease